MVWTKKNWQQAGETVLFLTIFALSLIPIENYDIWFHLKSGEVVSQRGLIHHDVFSYTAAGREWFPHEWLFEVTIYWLHHLFGFVAIHIMIATLAVASTWLLYRIIRDIIQLSTWPALATTWLFLVLSFDFITDRPHLLAYTLLLTNLYLILLYTSNSKYFLWLTLPVTLIWANTHGSIILNGFLFGSYTVLATTYYLLYKDPSWLKKTKVLAIYTTLTALLTILPPLYFTQYRQLWLFWLNKDTISSFLDEWMPIWHLNLSTAIFSSIILLAVSVWSGWNLYQAKKLGRWLWLGPLLAFIILAFVAARNLFLGYITLILLFAQNIPSLNKKMVLILYSILIVGSWGLLWQKVQPQPNTLPKAAVTFIKNNHLAGHLWHSFGQGGYLLYHLYPDQQVFYDGRADLYLCCEIKEFLRLSEAKDQADEQYYALLSNFFTKHDISFVLLPTAPASICRKISRILSQDPTWSLVFWDDQAEIYVRHDGKNQAIVANYTAQAATPYQQNLYKTNSEVQAEQEYQQMITIADSAHSRNALGVIYLRAGDTDQAQQQFNQAIQIDPTFESPYLNLGEMAASRGDYQQAIKLYREAQALAPQRSFISNRLQQLKSSIH